MLMYFVKLLGSDITQLYDLLMLRYVNYQTVNKTDSFSFRDMHVILYILYDSKHHHHRWQMTFDLGVIYKMIIDFSWNSGCIWKNNVFTEFSVFENICLDTKIVKIA